MSTSSTAAAFETESRDSSVVVAPPLTADPQVTREHEGTASTEKGPEGRPATRPRSNKRDFHASTQTNADETGCDVSPTLPAAKKPTAADRAPSERPEAKKKTLIDIDQKHANDPQYVSKLAPHVYKFLRHLETLVLRNDGQTLKTGKEYDNLAERRTRCINVMYNMNLMYQDKKQMQVPTDTIHLAIYYIDRFLERYRERRNLSLPLITATALFLASKFEDVDPIDIESILKNKTFGKEVRLMDVLSLEVKYQDVLYVLGAPTATAFAHRYLQACDLETKLAAVHTARYFCALGTAHFPLTGHYYSKIAAAAVFIAHNKYHYQPHRNTDTSEQNSSFAFDFPEAFEQHCEYTLEEIKPIVLTLVEVAKQVETMSSIRTNNHRDTLPIDVYHYYKRANVVNTCFLPNFSEFFAKLGQKEEESSISQEEMIGKACTEEASVDSKGDGNESGHSTPPAISGTTTVEDTAAVTSADQENPEESEATSA